MCANISNWKPVIGILALNDEYIEFYKYCAAAASFLGCESFYFSFRNINHNQGIIIGRTFQNGKWIKKRYNLNNGVDVIYDRLRASNHKQYGKVYEALKHIPFTHPGFGSKLNKFSFYHKFYEEGSLKENIIPFQKYHSSKVLLDFLYKHRQIILKPQSGSGGESLYYISLENSGVKIVVDNTEKIFSENNLNNFLSSIPNINNFVIQKYIKSRTLDGHPFDVRVHMGRNYNNEWSFLTLQPRVGFDYAKVSLVNNGGYISKWKGFITRNFGKNKFKKIDEDIRDISLRSLDILEKVYNKKLTEAGIDYVISNDGDIYFVEMNVNKPGGNFHEFELAYSGIGYAKYVALHTDESDYLI